MDAIFDSCPNNLLCNGADSPETGEVNTPNCWPSAAGSVGVPCVTDSAFAPILFISPALELPRFATAAIVLGLSPVAAPVIAVMLVGNVEFCNCTSCAVTVCPEFINDDTGVTGV